MLHTPGSSQVTQYKNLNGRRPPTTAAIYKSAKVGPTICIPQMASSCGALKSIRVKSLPLISLCREALSALPLVNIPNLKPTSETVTKMLIMMSTMMIHVIVLIFVSAMLSLRISASSRNTLQRSLRTWIRGVISRYSRIPV
jgi:hypothetical protein